MSNNKKALFLLFAATQWVIAVETFLWDYDSSKKEEQKRELASEKIRD